MIFRRFTRSPSSAPSARRALFVAFWVLAGPVSAQLSGLKDGDVVAPGAIEGVLLAPAEGERSLRGVTVTLLRTRATAEVDATGRYVLKDVPPGSYTLVAAGDGFSMLVITDVVVRPRQRVLLDAEEMPLASREGEVVRMEPVVVSARKQIEALERYEITEQRPEPFATSNVDLPRTIDDPQPYYLFDRPVIARSGAATLEEFMQRRVPMDATKIRLSDNVLAINTGLGVADNKSTINLNGFGSEHTVILVNGRRLPSFAQGGLQSTARQPDLNGIPLAAIERVEILPASNSAVYGSDAIGGVVNVVLRQDFRGTELEAGIENPYHGSAPIYRASFTAGRWFDEGRTKVMIAASHTKIEPLEYRHRRELLERYRGRAWVNHPTATGAPSYANVPLGVTTNVVAAPVTRMVNGQIITEPGALFGPGSTDRAFATEGYTGGAGRAAFEANAGKLSMDPAANASGSGAYLGMGSPLELETELSAGYATLRHRLLPRLELFAELSQSRNRSMNFADPGGITAEIPASVPTNVFGVPVRVTARVPLDLEPSRQDIVDERVVIGAKFELAGDWMAQADAAWASSRLRMSADVFQAALMQVDVQMGRVDVLRDLRASPIPLERYLFKMASADGSWLRTVNLRAGGPLGHLPAGEVTAALGLGVEESGRRDSVTRQTSASASDGRVDERRSPGGSQRDVHVYSETWLPLVSRANARGGLAQLDVQLAGRLDRFDVHDVDASGRDVAYESANFTAGLRYRPVGEVMLRASYSSGFRAPDFAEIRPMTPPLLGLPFSPNGWLPFPLQDPKRGGERTTQSTVSLGGNSAIQPEHSDNVTVGMVMEPAMLPGFRLSVDSTVIRRQDEIRMFDWQSIVNYEDQFPGRVVRGPVAAGDPHGVGPITFVDGSVMNVLDSRSVNYNLAVDYERTTQRAGRWEFFVIGNSWQHYQRRIAPGLPRQEQINNAVGITQGQPKFVGNAGVHWTGGRWSAGWTVRFYGHYRVGEHWVQAHGGEFVEDQMYHDSHVGYAFPDREGAGLGWLVSGVALQVGAKNVFNTPPRFEGSSVRFYSPYGDLRRGSVYLTVRKRF